MDFLENIKQIDFWNNSAYDYLVAIFVFVGLLMLLKIFQVIILARLQKLALITKTDLDDTLINTSEEFLPLKLNKNCGSEKLNCLLLKMTKTSVVLRFIFIEKSLLLYFI